MKIGLCSANVGACTRPDSLARVAERAEEVGLESFWVSEHLVLADPRVPPSPMDPELPILEPLMTLAFVAARTRTLRLGTGVLVLPLRNPVVLAKELATLDVLSDGRLIVGIGVGYVDREFEAIGVPFDRRGERTDEYLAAMRSIWADAHPSLDGDFVGFSGVQSRPRPVQRPHPPVVVGGWSPPALRRAAEHANGWYGWGLDPETTARILGQLREEVRRRRRDHALGELEITITPPGLAYLDVAKRYAALGVDRLNLQVRGDMEEDDVVRFVENVAGELVGRV
ncbi:MAG: LLM class F420-dependent oxidoreductase [Solirubrobacterales bacterium]